MSGSPFRELTGKELAQTRLGHPSVLFGDWRKYYDTVRVIRTDKLGGRKIHVVQLESAGLPPTLVSLDAENGNVLQTQQTVSSAAAAAPGAMLTTTTYSDYREIGGRRVPYLYTASTDSTGHTIFQVESVELGVDLAPDTFTLQLPTESDRGK
jgi:hypothetical protein